MRREKHTKVQYMKTQRSAAMAVNRNNFKRLTQLGPDLYEIESIPSRVHLDIPIQLGVTILNYAKLHMLQFYYNFMLKYFQREKFELCEMDTG